MLPSFAPVVLWSLVSLDPHENVHYVIAVVCFQMKFEANRKAEQERRRREMVRLKLWQDLWTLRGNLSLKGVKKKCSAVLLWFKGSLCSNSVSLCRLTKTLSGADQEGGGERHTLGDSCRAGLIAADSRRSVNLVLWSAVSFLNMSHLISEQSGNHLSSPGGEEQEERDD